MRKQVHGHLADTCAAAKKNMNQTQIPDHNKDALSGIVPTLGHGKLLIWGAMAKPLELAINSKSH